MFDVESHNVDFDDAGLSRARRHFSTVTLMFSKRSVFLMSGVAVGHLFDKLGARPLLLMGLICNLASHIGAILSKKFRHWLMTQGFLLGVSSALT